jgi:DNA-binding NarL/FixJ family response regulator
MPANGSCCSIRTPSGSRSAGAVIRTSCSAGTSRCPALIDELSQNGSYVNGDRVNKRVRLEHKDVMCFGSTRITFQDRSSAEQMDSTARVSEETWAPMTARDRDVLRALCRPLVDDSSALPASNEDIAEEVALSVDSVKARLRVQYERYGLVDLRQGEKRVRLARLLLSNGTFKPHDF